MKVYIGGSYSGRIRIRREAYTLAYKYGIVANCHWFKDEYFLEKLWDNNFGGAIAEAMARLDESQIRDADFVIIDTIDKSSSGGSDTELGLARSLGKKIIHIGPYRNIFQTLATEHYESWEKYYGQLSRK